MYLGGEGPIMSWVRRELIRNWKLVILFTFCWYIPWILANYLHTFCGLSRGLTVLMIIVGLSLDFILLTWGWSSGWGAPKCHLCGRPLERREEGSVVGYYCPVHGNVRGEILERS
jgi:hypothetical protein